MLDRRRGRDPHVGVRRIGIAGRCARIVRTRRRIVDVARLIRLDHGRRALRLVERRAEADVGDRRPDAFHLPRVEGAVQAVVLRHAIAAVDLQQVGVRLVLDQRRLHLDVRFDDVLRETGIGAAVGGAELGIGATLEHLGAEFAGEGDRDALLGERRGDAVLAKVTVQDRERLPHQRRAVLRPVGAGEQIVVQRQVAVTGDEGVERHAGAVDTADHRRAGRRAVDVHHVQRPVDAVVIRLRRVDRLGAHHRIDARDVVPPGIVEHLAAQAARNAHAAVLEPRLDQRQRVEAIADVERHEPGRLRTAQGRALRRRQERIVAVGLIRRRTIGAVRIDAVGQRVERPVAIEHRGRVQFDVARNPGVQESAGVQAVERPLECQFVVRIGRGARSGIIRHEPARPAGIVDQRAAHADPARDDRACLGIGAARAVEHTRRDRLRDFARRQRPVAQVYLLRLAIVEVARQADRPVQEGLARGERHVRPTAVVGPALLGREEGPTRRFGHRIGAIVVVEEAVVAGQRDAVEVLLQHEVDDACDRVRSIDRRGTARQNVDPLDQLVGDQADVHAVLDAEPQPVDQRQRAFETQAAQLDTLAAVGIGVILFGVGLHLRQTVHHLFDRRRALGSDVGDRDGGDRCRGAVVRPRDARARHDDVLRFVCVGRIVACPIGGELRRSDRIADLGRSILIGRRLGVRRHGEQRRQTTGRGEYPLVHHHILSPS